jgi:hypothetical protein
MEDVEMAQPILGPPPRRRRRPSRLLLAVAALPAAYLAWRYGRIFLASFLFGSNPFDLNPFDDRPYSRAVWLEDRECVTAGNRRAGMAEQILRRNLRPGQTSEQVAILLGDPDTVWDRVSLWQQPERFRPEDGQTQEVWTYYLGEELGGEHNGHLVDRAWLDLRFDAHGQYAGGAVFTP